MTVQRIDLLNYAILTDDLDKDIASLDGMIEAFYEDGGWSYKPLMQLQSLDIQQVSAWSLDNVAKMLSDVRSAIFGNEPEPPGVDIEKPAEFTGALKDLLELNLLALSRAFQVVQSILQQFATESSYKGKAIQRNEVIAPGLTIFVSIRSDVWKNKGWFNNDSIAQYLFVIRGFFSLEQAGDLSKFNDLLAYEDLKSGYRARMKAVAKTIADPKTPFKALVELEEELGYYAERLAEIQAKIDELQKKEIKEHLGVARNAIASRRILLSTAA